MPRLPTPEEGRAEHQRLLRRRKEERKEKEERLVAEAQKVLKEDLWSGTVQGEPPTAEKVMKALEGLREHLEEWRSGRAFRQPLYVDPVLEKAYEPWRPLILEKEKAEVSSHAGVLDRLAEHLREYRKPGESDREFRDRLRDVVPSWWRTT